MKLVFTLEETAAALGKSVADFKASLAGLHALGFPRPVLGLGACWSIMDVIRWVNREEQPTLATVAAEVAAAGLEEEFLGRTVSAAPAAKAHRH